jgi:hypothetical protein
MREPIADLVVLADASIARQLDALGLAELTFVGGGK